MLSFPDRDMEPGRVFCIGRNYREHIKELGGDTSEDCIVFMKPGSSLVPPKVPVRLPRDRGTIHHEVELVVVIGKGGTGIQRDKAPAHVEGVTLGVDLTLRDLQNQLKKKGQPWELCKAFEQSAPIGEFIPFDSSLDLGDIQLQCLVNDELRQDGNTRDMISSVSRLIEILSGYWELGKGDLIFTGTPSGVGPVCPGDILTVKSPQIGTFTWELV